MTRLTVTCFRDLDAVDYAKFGQFQVIIRCTATMNLLEKIVVKDPFSLAPSPMRGYQESSE